MAKRLMFEVGLVNKITAPLHKIQQQIGHLQQGAVGLFAGGFGLRQALQPALEIQAALGEVQSLGVSEEALRQLNKAALDVSGEYGISASTIIEGSYDLQSAIAGLSGEELSRLSEIAAVTATGTKASVQTMTSYFGTMAGIFQKDLATMGKIPWAQALAGQTAQAVRMFKTTGEQMEGAFRSVGAAASSMRIPIQEQITVLGTLQATMSGSEAGTKYKAFLAGVGQAQKTLGLSFTDASGKILPITDILRTVQTKFGDLKTVAQSDLIKKAFGSQEAVNFIKQLIQQSDTLENNMEAIGQAGNLKTATRMAQIIADPWDQARESLNALRITFGQLLLPTLNQIMAAFAKGAGQIKKWSDRFPNIARFVGVISLALISLVSAVSAMSVAVAALKIASLGLGVAWKMLISLSQILRAQTWLKIKALLAEKIALWGTAVGVAFLTLQEKISLVWKKAVTLATWLFNAALWANPITWVIAAVIALTLAVASLIVYWDQVRAAFFSVAAWFASLPRWAQTLSVLFAPFLSVPLIIIREWEAARAFFAGLFSTLSQGFRSILDFLKKLTLPDWLDQAFSFFSSSPKTTLSEATVERQTLPNLASQEGLRGVARSLTENRSSQSNVINVTTNQKLEEEDVRRWAFANLPG